MSIQPSSKVRLPVYARIAETLSQGDNNSSTEPVQTPSVREVAERFDVSIVTASRALQLLRERRSTAEEAAAQSAISGRWAVCLHVTPGLSQQERAAGEVVAEGFRALGRRRNIQFDFEAVQFDPDISRDALQRKLAAAEIRGVYLLPSRLNDALLRQDELLIDAARESKIPVVLLERNLRGPDRRLEHDLVTIDDFHGGRALGKHFLDQHRQRIAFVFGSPTSTHQERLGGYLSSMFEVGREPVVIYYPNDLTPKSAYVTLVDQILDRQVDAVIAYHDTPAFGMIMELLRRGVSVPKTIAVAGFNNMAIGDSYSIGITSFAFPALDVATRAVDVMKLRLESPDSPPIRVVVAGNMIVRESTVDSHVA